MKSVSVIVCSAISMVVLVVCVSGGNYGNQGYNYNGGWQGMYPSQRFSSYQFAQPYLVQAAGALGAGGFGGLATGTGFGLGLEQLIYYVVLIFAVYWIVEQINDNDN